MMKKLHFILLIGLIFTSRQQSFAQSPERKDSTEVNYTRYFDEVGNFPKKAKETLEQFSVNGYYRFVTNYRHLEVAYPHLAANKNNIFVGDDSQIPQLMLNISGSATKNTSFGTDLFLWTPMTGLGAPENVKGLNLGISLYGNYSSSIGDFNVRTGGINWYSLTPFTFQSSKGYNRYSIFERNPWDVNTKDIDTRYATFYNSGAINQEERWGQQAFQGVIAEANSLPNGLSAVFMYGKTQLNGGLSPLPNSSIGGKIKKEYGANYISLNTFNNRSFTDSTQRYSAGFNVVTAEFKNKIKAFQFSGEIGAGRTLINDTSNAWGEAISLKIATTIADKFPTEIHFFRISPKVINNSASFINSSMNESVIVIDNATTRPVLPAVASAMVPVGQLVNNRQGIDLNTQIDIGNVKTSFGYNYSEELSNTSSQLTYSHPINSLALAHFWRWDFPTAVGPYNNLSKIYRTVYETVNLTKLDPATGLPARKKYFNNLELNTKFKSKLLGRDYYIYYLGQYSSAQFYASPLTVFNEKALLRTYYHQLELYLVLNKSLVWCNYVGYERIIGNYDTQTDVESQRPKNQTGYSLATGFDIRLSKGAGLYLRQRWMDYKDSSFKKDTYKGFETTVEVKIFF